MAGDKEKLTNMEYKGGREVVIVNNSRLSITHIGKTVFALRFSPYQIHMENVYHVPGVVIIFSINIQGFNYRISGSYRMGFFHIGYRGDIGDTRAY